MRSGISTLKKRIGNAFETSISILILSSPKPTHVRSAIHFLLFILLANVALAQNEPVISNPSPNTSSFTVAKDFPAALPTGVPNISVPIYNLEYHGITVPIALNYNINLVKPDLHPSWVGLGWGLTVGGAINRIVNDKPDEMQYYDQNTYDKLSLHDVGYLYNNTRSSVALTRTDWASNQAIKDFTDDWKTYPGYGADFVWPATVRDYEPDEFSFSFLGFSGVFYLNENGQFKVRCDQNVKVEYDTEMVRRENATLTDVAGFKKFIITDPNGIKYVFGGYTAAIEYTQTAFTTDGITYVPKTWYLTQIVMPGGKTISFNYERKTSDQPIITATPSVWQLDAYPNTAHYTRLSCSIILPSYLQSIETDLQKIEFSRSASNQLPYKPGPFIGEEHFFEQRRTDFYNRQNEYFNHLAYPVTGDPILSNFDGRFVNAILPPIAYLYATDMGAVSSLPWKKLDSIKVTDKLNNRSVKKFLFDYVNTPTERLKLLHLRQAGSISSSENTYSFAYYQNKLPDYLSTKTDTWGYYNGKLPDYSTADNYSTSRMQNLDSTRAETLSQVTYPTGGYTTYEYELHSYSKVMAANTYSDPQLLNSSAAMGGMRIHKITNFVSAGNVANYITYNYNTPGTSMSSGVMVGDAKLAYESNPTDGFKSIYYPVTYIDVFLSQTYPGESQSGSPIGYSYVTQNFSDGSRTESQFSNFDNGTGHEYYDLAPEYAFPNAENAFTSKAFERGRLLFQKTYNAANVPLSEKTITYSRVYKSGDPGFVKSVSTRAVQSSAFQWQTNYTINNGNQTITGYTPIGSYPPTYLGFATKKLTYNYLPTSETTKLYNASGNIEKTVTYQYNPDNLNIAKVTESNSKGETQETSNLYAGDMVAANRDPNNIYSAMVTANMTGPLVESVNKINGTQVSLHRTEYNNIGIAFFKPSLEVVQNGTATPQTVMNYSAYDNWANLTAVKKNNLAKTAYVYGYQKNLPVAKIENATEQQVYHNNFEEMSTIGIAHTGYGYHNGSFDVPLITVDGETLQLTYWYRLTGTNTWKYAVESYTGPRTILPAGADAIDDVSVYPADAQITTYTYSTLAGITSSTDTKGNTVFYEYDEFQRLINIKDQYGRIKSHYCYNFAGQLTNCAIPVFVGLPDSPQMIYAKIVISNSYSSTVSGYAHTFNTYVGSLYSDYNCTMPYIASAPITINYATLITYTNTTDTWTDTATGSFVIQADHTSSEFGTFDMAGCYIGSNGPPAAMAASKTSTTSTTAKTTSSKSTVSGGGAHPNVLPPSDPSVTCYSGNLVLQAGTGYTGGNY